MFEVARNIRVMVVENYVPLRASLAQLLFSWGYEAETASDGLEALERIPSFDPAVVISGLQMPRMGGMELLRALHHRAPQINCIMVSADANLEKVSEAIRLGAFSLLEKPVEAERLHMDLRKCLERYNSGSGPEDPCASQRDVLSGQEVAPIPSRADELPIAGKEARKPRQLIGQEEP